MRSLGPPNEKIHGQPRHPDALRLYSRGAEVELHDNLGVEIAQLRAQHSQVGVVDGLWGINDQQV